MLNYTLMLGGWALADLMLILCSFRLLRRVRSARATRFLLTVVVSFQIAYLAYTWASAYLGGLPDVFPLILHIFAYMWHFLVLPASLVVFAVVWIGSRIATGFRKPAMPPGSPGAEGVATSLHANVPERITRRSLLRVAVIAAPPVVGLALTGSAFSSLGQFRVRRLSMSFPTLPPELDGVTIAHVTDLHIGRFLREGMIERVADAVNALDVDLIAFTGDLNDLSAPSLKPGVDFIRRLRARHGMALIEGNHDVMPNADRFENTMRDAGLPLLVDESITLWPRGSAAPGIQFFGLSWGELHTGRELGRAEVDTRFRLYSEAASQKSLAKAMERKETAAFPILLAHHPHAFDAAVAEGLPLTLSGHTHGGQLMLTPGLGVGPLRYRYWSGLYQQGGSKLLVANGVGNWFPLRLNAPQEIVHLTLRRHVGNVN